ncbi:hypothetical protein OSH11_11695 [Kaistia dalseonensis]|uniref:Head-to-tail adaptor n=1 Tax=Kaistia dalseonensis TaxID=410840 RepID=A0ABU0H6M3_9HYPH|nr:hypothetical protein [Kaistia dalseonensis]MCX5495373.1 hypothetical protein [Kaistia dalseonensis]MDQ0437960.1 hypothetical protein [Kaistia dalseonensis]
MPLLDVSDVLADPDFADTLTLTRATQSVGSDGIATRAEVVSTISGVVTSNSGDVLKRFPDMARVSGSILVHTTARLVASDGPTEADRLTWQGRDYTVSVLNDYSSYGAGFVVAGCELLQLT